MREIVVKIGFGVCAIGCLVSLCWGIYGIYQNMANPIFVVAMDNSNPGLIADNVSIPVVVEVPKIVVQEVAPVADNVSVSSGSVRCSFTVVDSDNETPSASASTAITGVISPR